MKEHINKNLEEINKVTGMEGINKTIIKAPKKLENVYFPETKKRNEDLLQERKKNVS